ncbi:MAG: hypothetical protein ABRQ39_04625 [Candidatus Eremiobacterota bacterium]
MKVFLLHIYGTGCVSPAMAGVTEGVIFFSPSGETVAHGSHCRGKT